MAEQTTGTKQGDPIRDELNALREDLAKVREDLSAVTEAIKGVASEKAQSGRERVEEETHRVWEEAVEKLDEVLGRGRVAAANVEQQVAQHPGTSLLTAFGIGFLLAKVLGVRANH